MSQITDVIALIFDFDDTLAPDSTVALLASRGIDTSKFWAVQRELIQSGYDPPLAYLKLLLDNIGKDKPLGELTNRDLIKFATSIDNTFHEGLPEFFDEIKDDVKNTYKDIEVEYYIVSGGLQSIIESTVIVQKYFTGVYGCQLTGDSEDGVLKYIKRCVTFTEKTRYLFEINKGITPSDSQKNPYFVNKFVPTEKRRVPFSNMIYVGDGLTDVPCFSLITSLGGFAFGVFDPTKKDKAKLAFEEFLQPHRVSSMHAPRFTPDSELGTMLHTAVLTRCSKIQLQRGSAL